MAVGIRRDRRWERTHRPALDAAVADLQAFAALDAGTARVALGTRLAALRLGLWGSPYHREALAARGLSPSDLQDLDDLPAFPTLDRATLAARWRDVPAVRPDDDLVVARSSGSTGAPVTFVRRAGESLHMWATIRFFVERLGVAPLPPRPRVVLLCALPDAPEYSAHLPLLGDGALHRLSVRRADTAARLRRVAPSIVTGDPESLRWLAENPVVRPALIFSSALQLPADLRARLPAPVVNLYSTTETGAIAWECLAAGGTFHVLLPDCWVESLAGELAVTRLRPGAVPLLRYQTGDGGEVMSGACSCGHAGFSIVGFSGRCACVFSAPDGTSVDAWQLAPLLRDLPLRSFRVTQTGAQDFLVEVDGAAARDVGARVARRLTALGFTSPTVTVSRAAPVHGAKPEPFRSLVSLPSLSWRCSGAAIR